MGQVIIYHCRTPPLIIKHSGSHPSDREQLLPKKISFICHKSVCGRQMNLSQIVLNSLCVPHFGLLTLQRAHHYSPFTRMINSKPALFRGSIEAQSNSNASVSGNGCNAPHVGWVRWEAVHHIDFAVGFISLLNKNLIFSDPCFTRLILA
jgi:hypothetical protein